MQVAPSYESASSWGRLVTECSTETTWESRGLFSPVTLRGYNHQSREGLTFAVRDHAKWLVLAKQRELSRTRVWCSRPFSHWPISSSWAPWCPSIVSPARDQVFNCTTLRGISHSNSNSASKWRARLKLNLLNKHVRLQVVNSSWIVYLFI